MGTRTESSTSMSMPVNGGGAVDSALTVAAVRVRLAYAMVHATHSTSATANIALRSANPEDAGSCASFMAMPAWNGFTGPNALPTIAAPALIATTVTPSTPTPRPSSSITGTSGMISSCMFSSAPIVANSVETIGTSSRPLCRNRQAACPTARMSVPRRSTMTHAPPQIRTTTMTSAASMKPRGTATAAANAPTGLEGTGW